ncbi:class I SAM-dependent methyltransferase [Reichenbachiella sp. MALMAid0571]|uniref:class I SAM-dependent methyltransferase n=1 Tax=Reichenbachiella sp. MALMAid0571 TaxID=3143939 RepID=UPI0032DF7382
MFRIQNFLPKTLRKILTRVIKNELLKQRIAIEAEIPKIDFKKDHLQNAKLLINRSELLEMLPKNGVVAEIGVDEGGYSSQILELNNPKKLHLVDSWSSEQYRHKREKVEKKFIPEINQGRVEINLGLSTEVCSNFPDKYFDWVYIDTGHGYKLTKEELICYSTKMKDGGVIVGHDFITWEYLGFNRYGVIEAVSEFCNEYDWELIFLTMEVSGHPSFAIRKISNTKSS